MEEWWEEELDVDDSDLLSLPSLRPCSSSSYKTPSNPIAPPPPPPAPSLIPGPAAAVQAAMHRSAAHRRDPSTSLPDTQRAAAADSQADDGDFILNPWLSATRFLGNCSPTPIGSINGLKNTADRVPRVVGIVKSCVPNGLGDLFVTLKDRTGTIGASIHRRVVTDGNLGGEVAVGCVLILNQVVVFCPARSACYLNVTLNNVVKLISKDCGPPHIQIIPPYRTTYDATGAHGQTGIGEGEKEPWVRHEVEIIADDNVRRNFNSLICKEYRSPHVQMLPLFTGTYGPTGNHRENGCEEAEATSSMKKRGAESIATDNLRRKLSSKVVDNRNAGGTADKLLLSNNAAAPTKVAKIYHEACEPSSKARDEMTRNFNVKIIDNREAESFVGSLAVSMIATAPPGKAAKLDLMETEPKKMISKATVAEWTDEQLLELFSDYQDDV